MKQVRLMSAMLGGVIALLLPGTTQAVDVSFIPRLEVGVESYELKVNGAFRVDPSGAVESGSKINFNDVMPVASGGLTVVVDQFYIDFSGQKSFDGDDDWSRVYFDSSEPIPLVNAKGSVGFDRTEYAIALGYLLTDNLSIYVGYRKSTLDNDFSSVVSAPLFGNIGATKVSMDFEEDGFFVGASYGWQVDSATFNGVLSGSIALANLDGDLNVKSVTTTGALNGVPDDSSEGDTLGMKVGLTWKGATQVDQLTYTLGVNGYKYEFDADGDAADITETVVNFKIGLAYVF